MATIVEADPQAPDACQCGMPRASSSAPTPSEAHPPSEMNLMEGVMEGHADSLCNVHKFADMTFAFQYVSVGATYEHLKVEPQEAIPNNVTAIQAAIMRFQAFREWYMDPGNRYMLDFGSRDFDKDEEEYQGRPYEESTWDELESMPDLEDFLDEVVRRRCRQPARRQRHSRRGQTPEFVRRMMPGASQS